MERRERGALRGSDLHGGRGVFSVERVTDARRLRRLANLVDERGDGRRVVRSSNAIARDDHDRCLERMLGQLGDGRSIPCCCIEHEGRAKQHRHCGLADSDSNNSSCSDVAAGYSFFSADCGSGAAQFAGSRSGGLDRWEIGGIGTICGMRPALRPRADTSRQAEFLLALCPGPVSRPSLVGMGPLFQRGMGPRVQRRTQLSQITPIPQTTREVGRTPVVARRPRRFRF